MPRTHCAFRCCDAQNLASEEALRRHLEEEPEHQELLLRVTRLMPATRDPLSVRLFSAYCEALAEKVRKGAPVDTYAIDRRAILNYTRACGDDQIYSLICMSCARRFPYMKGLKEKNEIAWRQPLDEGKEIKFLGMDARKTAEIFGLDVYIDRY